jgi:predicted RNA-binding Zn-ribbon protein involved in translation (DUF1610 family)
MSRKSSAKHKFTCPHCGAAYEVSAVRHVKPAYRTATCSYCGDVMAEWNGPSRHYHRIKHPRSATQVAKIVEEVASGRRNQRRLKRPRRGKRGFAGGSQNPNKIGRKRKAAG